MNVIMRKLLSQAAGHPISWFVKATHSPHKKRKRKKEKERKRKKENEAE